MENYTFSDYNTQLSFDSHAPIYNNFPHVSTWNDDTWNHYGYVAPSFSLATTPIHWLSHTGANENMRAFESMDRSSSTVNLRVSHVNPYSMMSPLRANPILHSSSSDITVQQNFQNTAHQHSRSVSQASTVFPFEVNIKDVKTEYEEKDDYQTNQDTNAKRALHNDFFEQRESLPSIDRGMSCKNAKKEQIKPGSHSQDSDCSVKKTDKNQQLLNVAENLPAKKHVCIYCEKSFDREWNLKRHVLTHEGERKYQCSVCEKRFVLCTHLQIHMRTHTGEKPYSCSVCNRSFAQCTNLRRHKLTHTGERPHKCLSCGKGFISNSDLKRHIRVHTGEKPYECTLCDKIFTTIGNLKSHQLWHTGIRPYNCKICNGNFITKSNLRTHIKCNHGLKDIPVTSSRVVEKNIFLSIQEEYTNLLKAALKK